MKQYNKITPDGTRDRLFDECNVRESITNRLSSMFSLRGYRRVANRASLWYSAVIVPFQLQGWPLPV